MSVTQPTSITRPNRFRDAAQEQGPFRAKWPRQGLDKTKQRSSRTTGPQVGRHAMLRAPDRKPGGTHGPAATDRRTGPRLDARAEGPLVVRARVSRRHAATHAALRGDRVPARRVAERHQPVRRRQDGLDARRRPHLGDPRVRAVPCLLAPRCARHDDPREQLRAVDRDGRRLHDHAAHVRPRGLHVGHEQRPAVVADHGVHDRAVGAGRAGRVPDEAPLRQRRAAPVPGRPRLRRRARRALRPHGGRGRDVEGTRTRRGGRARGQRELPLRRELHAAGPGEVARAAVVLAPAHEPGRLVLLARRTRLRAVAEARGRRRAPARAFPGARLRDDRRRRAHGHPHGRQPAARRGAEFRRRRAGDDHDRRDPAARRLDRRRHRALRPGPHRQQLGALVGHLDDGRGVAGRAVRAPRGLRRGVPEPAPARPQCRRQRRRAGRRSSCRCRCRGSASRSSVRSESGCVTRGSAWTGCSARCRSR